MRVNKIVVDRWPTEDGKPWPAFVDAISPDEAPDEWWRRRPQPYEDFMGMEEFVVMNPQRIQLRRTKGWRKPAGAVVVSRPTIFGNPFRAYKCSCCGYWDVVDNNGVTYLVNHEYVRRPEVRADQSTWTTQEEAVRESVRLYYDELTYWVGGRLDWDPEFAAKVEGLRGKDLCCWCPPSQPCHADVLLKVANS